MNYLIFNRESNDFTDILADIKTNKIHFKLRFSNYLIIGFDPKDEKTQSLFILKYSDDMKLFNNVVPDRTPVPNKDYVPIRK